MFNLYLQNTQTFSFPHLTLEIKQVSRINTGFRGTGRMGILSSKILGKVLLSNIMMMTRGGYRNFEKGGGVQLKQMFCETKFFLERRQFCKHQIIWETIVLDVDGTKVWLIDEVVKRLPNEARKKLWEPSKYLG